MKSALPASISKVTTMRDKTVRLQVDCQEIAPESMAEIFALNDTLGWFLFQEKPNVEMDLKDLPDIKMESWEKHPSQRLRAIWYRVWENTDRKLSFEQFYREKMDMMCEFVKEKYL